MQLKRVLFIIIIVLMCTPISAFAQSEEVSSTELIENAAYWDKKQITYTGEVIGDILVRGDYAWINISDGENTMSCYLSAENTKAIENLGRYGVQGDVVCVQGTFYRASAAHGGDMDIDGSSLKLISKGHVLENKYSPLTLCLSGAALLCAVLMIILVIRKQK